MEQTGDLTALNDAWSWKTLLRAAQIRQYRPILDLVHKLKDDNISVIYITTENGVQWYIYHEEGS